MERVSPRITGVGRISELSVTVAETRACAKDFVVCGGFWCDETIAIEEGFPVEANSVCQSKAMAGLTAMMKQTGRSTN